MNNSTLITFMQARPTHEERLAKGKAVRQLVPRATLANLTIRNRGQIVVDVLRKQAASRIAELTPVRHARMMANPFAFFRGGAAIMAADLSKTPSPEITVQLCGDMHVSNFGFFSTTEHQLVFGINDFDETLPGNFDWDLKRLAASAMIAAEALGKDQTFGEHMVRNLCRCHISIWHEPILTRHSLLLPQKMLGLRHSGFSRKWLPKRNPIRTRVP
jgi:uncharacterized protein (DUF2252 family)